MGGDIKIGAFDFAVILAYLAVIVVVGLWAGIRQRQSEDKDYFLAGRSLSWFAIGLALFSTNISTLELVALVEEGYKRGLLFGNTEVLAPVSLIMLSLFFVPFYIRSNISTLPSFLEKRYGKSCRYLLVVFALGYAIFGHLGFALFTGGKVVEGLFGIPLVYGMTLILVLTGVYTVIGGLKSVVVTEVIQAFVLLGGMVMLVAVSLHEVGGWQAFLETVADEPERLQLLRGDEAAADMKWYAVLLGYPIIGIWFWCTDQTIVQRVLGAKDQNHAQIGPLFAGMIKIAGLFLFVLPGMFCYALVEQGKISPINETATTLSFMIAHLMPAGITGLMAAAMLAALMSTVAAALNSAATLCSFDIYGQIFPNASDRSMIHVGRIVTLLAMIAAVVWAPFIQNFGSILEGNTMLIAYMSPSVAAVFLWGVFWKRASNAGAIACLACGIVLGGALFALHWNEMWPLSFMLTCFLLFVLCTAILAVVSLWKPQELTEEQRTLVWDHPLDIFREPGWRGIGNYKVLSLIVFLTMAAVLVIF